MNSSFEYRIKSIAYELAKKDSNYNEDQDKENQNKLKIILNKSSINEDIIRMKINGIINDLKRNPNYRVTKYTGEEILNVMEQHLISGGLESISQMDNEEFLTRSVTDVVIENDRIYNKEITAIVEKSYIRGEEIILSAEIIKQLILGNLSKEKLENLSNIFENSKEVSDKNVDSIDKILNNTAQGKDEALTYLSAKKVGENCNYFKENRDRNSQRGAIFILARKALSGDKTLMQEACIKAAQFGLKDLIKEDGTINMDLAYQKFIDSIQGDKKLMDRYATKEDFVKEVKEANERGKINIEKDYSKDKAFTEGWRRCSTKEEKDAFMKKYSMARKIEDDIFVQIRKNSTEGRIEETKELIRNLSQSTRHNIEECVLKLISNSPVSKELQEVVNQTFNKAEKLKKQEENGR